MPAERSIPKTLEDTIVRKWITGRSPEAIADWIIQTNRRRKHPVQTSRSSVERLLAEQMARDHTIPRLQVTLEAGRNVTRHYARLLEITAELAQLQAEEPNYANQDEARADRAKLSRRLRLLSHEERTLMRLIRLAGVGGSAGLQLQNSKAVEHLRADEENVAAVEWTVDEALARAGVAAEKSVRFDAGSTVESSGSALPPVMPAELPRIEDPDWQLTPEQRQDWEDTKAAVHLFLLATWGYNGCAAPKVRPLAEPLPEPPSDRAALRIAEVVPVLTLPVWPLTKDQTRHLEQQMKRVNAWLAWFRADLHEHVAGRGNWRKDWNDPNVGHRVHGFVEA